MSQRDLESGILPPALPLDSACLMISYIHCEPMSQDLAFISYATKEGRRGGGRGGREGGRKRGGRRGGGEGGREREEEESEKEEEEEKNGL